MSQSIVLAHIAQSRQITSAERMASPRPIDEAMIGLEKLSEARGYLRFGQQSVLTSRDASRTLLPRRRLRPHCSSLRDTATQ